jgi:uncharacterized protein
MTAAVSHADGALLARLAAAAVAVRLGGRPDAQPEADVLVVPALLEKGASFVTLERCGMLRGCIGSLEASCPLYRDVLRNAVRAMTDPRLPPVTVDDWLDLDVKVSVLGALQPLPSTTRDELLAALRPGVDGLILTDGHRRATFLPAVWDKLPEPDRYVAALLRKGGWPADGWPAGLVARRYGSREFHDPAPRTAFVV